MNQRSFNIFLQSGQKKPGLRRSFLRELCLQPGMHNVELEDKSVWPIHIEPEVQQALNKQGYASCILSFQVFQDGEFFAIARLFNEELVKEKGN